MEHKSSIKRESTAKFLEFLDAAKFHFRAYRTRNGLTQGYGTR